MLYSNGASVLPVLKAWLLRTWHRLWTIVCWMHWCLSLTHRLNRCYWVFLTWLSMHTQLHRCSGVGSSDNHRMSRWWGISLTGAADSAFSRPICRGDHLDPWNIFYLWISTILWHLYDWLDLSSWWWIGHGVSTIDWTLRLDDELDMLTHIHGTQKLLQVRSHKLISPIDYVVTQSLKSQT